MFKKKRKQKKKTDGITKQKRKIYIFNRVPPTEGCVTSCAFKSELIHTTPSLNYTHLQNLTRSLAKKKKKR